jgi:hypothetical protein
MEHPTNITAAQGSDKHAVTENVLSFNLTVRTAAVDTGIASKSATSGTESGRLPTVNPPPSSTAASNTISPDETRQLTPALTGETSRKRKFSLSSLYQYGGRPILSSDYFIFSRMITSNISGKQRATAVHTS